MLVDKNLRDFLAAISSPAPTPGGGSAAAFASAMGASLLLMVAGLPKTRNGSEDDRRALDACMPALTGVRQRLAEAVDADTSAYEAVVTAYRQPRTTEAEQTARAAAIQREMRGATDVPLGVMRLSASALAQAPVVAAHGNKSAASDVGVAVALLGAGLRGAGMNVEINLEHVTDARYVDAVRAEARRLSADAAQNAAACEELLGR
ncbi:MAG: cyclodeaminase/cyclohydrolase family protein [Betaproteobacteria bacterium]